MRDAIQGVQVSAPFNNVKYALEVFEALPEFSRQEKTEAAIEKTEAAIEKTEATTAANT
ncbi:MAG TPA: hypothetical protein VJ866_11150 [Pyrinomonadaceae bacterium]|nr:hypothetical protein [Pyrinomonadaceae bacterium]